ncbi:MAG: carboxypeptidase-like regulatory domain-containing protein [Planctomycetota bacterium]|nr:carboxypeptidase-like regulatory domain-containing protein [Planctomycetota bacterium]
MLKRHGAIVLVVLVAVVVFGCGRDPNLPDMQTVTGTVTVDGKPLHDAVVIFYPTGNTRGTRAHGRTDAQGRYSLTSSKLGEGTPTGSYRVTVSHLTMPDGSPMPKDKDFDPMTMSFKENLPAQYSQRNATKLTATVPEGGGEVDFALNSRGQ